MVCIELNTCIKEEHYGAPQSIIITQRITLDLGCLWFDSFYTGQPSQQIISDKSRGPKKLERLMVLIIKFWVGRRWGKKRTSKRRRKGNYDPSSKNNRSSVFLFRSSSMDVVETYLVNAVMQVQSEITDITSFPWSGNALGKYIFFLLLRQYIS